MRRALVHMARRLRRDAQGVTALEFALAAPLLLMIMAVLIELGMSYYLQTVLVGTINAAGRASSMQSAQTTSSTIDSQVTARIHHVIPWATVAFNRGNYTDFTNVGQPEDFTDTNKNGQYDLGECFNDANGNGVWDSDMGATGLGGANDVVVYTVTVSYAPLFGFSSMLGLPSTMHASSSTIMRNQPFATQTTRTVTKIC
ncbi:TadE/TadG family type IV pilus assembly protein [Sphingomonas sp. R3G8C]|uniref:TadE/TadG family type IV pilus assembly protein n=1 Tax=Novosphingobium rhizosphaerae TaxID=1551649 RepID=UPI001C547248